jgi:hypothetical protein
VFECISCGGKISYNYQLLGERPKANETVALATMNKNAKCNVKQITSQQQSVENLHLPDY